MDQESWIVILNALSDSDALKRYALLENLNALEEMFSNQETDGEIMQDEEIDDLCKKFVRYNKDIYLREAISKFLHQYGSIEFNDSKSVFLPYYIIQNDVVNIKTLMTYITDQEKNWKDIGKKLTLTLSLDDEKFRAYHLVKCNIFYKILAAVFDKPELVDIIVRMIIVACNQNQKVIYLIGENLPLVYSILHHLDSNHDLLVLSVLRFLKLAVRSIKNDYKADSCWVDHFKNNRKLFQRIVYIILQFPLNEDLLLAAITFLKETAETNLPNKSNLLQQLGFDMHSLISVLMRSCIQMIKLKNNNYEIDSEFAYNWLSIMTIIRKNLVALFNKYTSESSQKLSSFLTILRIILQPYQKPEVLSSKRKIDEIRQDIKVIAKSVPLISYINRTIYVSSSMHHSVMKIILNLKTVLDVESGEENSDSVMLLRDFYTHLNQLWLNAAQNKLFIVSEVIESLNQEERQHFLKLVESHCYIQHGMKNNYDKKISKINKKKFLSLI